MVKQLYYQQVYSYLRSSTETQVELTALEEVAMSDRGQPQHITTPHPLQPGKGQPPAEMSVMIFWHQFTVNNAVDFLLTAWDKVSEACLAPPCPTPLGLTTRDSHSAFGRGSNVGNSTSPRFTQNEAQEVQETHSIVKQQDPFEILECVM
ncbi:hypothetical protein Pmani_028697 [Petrolisthes manimaculis]|uniref:Uncharacterized protein n=1 Tax=Petrolisthes manimaculis TaxID=1843537 RepID=A0AAE1P1Q3_9EUCA|nr:hypothetical protein Pmani_028697 [Petrolisthes manimaculis]